MGRIPRVPPELLSQPFTLDDARRARVSRSALRGSQWQRLAKGLYRARHGDDSPLEVLSGWHRTFPSGTAFAGATAAWLHGFGFDPIHPIEVIVSPDRGVRSRPGLNARRCVLGSEEVVTVRGLPATSIHRSLADLCCVRSPAEALVFLDKAVETGRVRAIELTEYANAIGGRAGSARLRALAQIAAPAESPMETRLRWHFLSSGLDRPEVQVDLYDAAGVFVARADMYYPEARLIVEYDGSNHKERLVSDDRRQNLIVNAGYRLLRYTGADLRDRPEEIVMQVRAALQAGAAKRTF